MSTTQVPRPDESQRQRDLQEIQDALRGLRFGTVNVIVQDGVVIQIDRLEKRRLQRGTKTRDEA